MGTRPQVAQTLNEPQQMQPGGFTGAEYLPNVTQQRDKKGHGVGFSSPTGRLHQHHSSSEFVCSLGL